MQDGAVAGSTLAQSKNHPTAIRSFIAIVKVASFITPLAGNELAMSASTNVLGALIAAFSIAQESYVASSPPLLLDNTRSVNRYLFAVTTMLPFASPLHVMSCNGHF